MPDTIDFYKYQGTGNDFVMIDQRESSFILNKHQIEFLCNRRFGIGADGLILLKNHSDYHFEMCYYNSDGNQSTMCGNGGRCLVAFAHFLNIFQEKCRFLAIDGEHEAQVMGDSIKLKMRDVDEIKPHQSGYVVFTGSPHYVRFQESIHEFDVFSEGKRIRNSEAFKKEGINVNFIEKITENHIKVRTYERGVENETLSCGTGVTASALVVMSEDKTDCISIETLGGNLQVQAESYGNGFRNIYLIGPAKQVFKGEISL